MKILALRGENLASLRGPFALEFNQGMLAQTGLYAITGPTGAGKSTLLDAICLALYDRMPRLGSGRGGVAVGRADQNDKQRVRSHDVRAVLSRGAGSGFAEVDFIGRDNHAWRARWQVRRARNKAEGALQQAEMSLLELHTEQVVSDKKSEVLKAIEHAVGLTWEQFRRSVLLAQGDFAAFLKADAAERSALLERMTGTAIYSDISRSAHERAKLASEQYAALEQQLAQLALLTPEQREQLTLELSELSGEQSQYLAQQQQLDKLGQALQRQQQAQQQLDTAHPAQPQAPQALDELEQRQDRLQQVEQAQALRPLYSRLEHDKLERAELKRRLAGHQAELEQAQQGTEQADRQLAEAEAALQRAEQTQRERQPEISQAQTLDHQLAELAQALSQARELLEQRQASYRPAKQEQAELNQQRAQLEQQLAQSKALLERQAALVELGAAAEPLLKSLAELPELLGNLGELERASRQWQHKQQELSLRQRELEPRTKRIVPELTRVGEQLAVLEQQLAEQQYDTLQQRFDTRQQSHQQLQLAYGLLREWHHVALQHAESERQRAELEQEAKRVAELLQNSQQALGELKPRLDEAERSFEQSRAIVSLDDYRAELKPGEACPLCGATEHPYAEHSPMVQGLLQQQAERVRQLRIEQEQLQHQLGSAKAFSQQVAQSDSYLSAQQQATAEKLAGYAEHWQQLDLSQVLTLEPSADQTPPSAVQPQQLADWLGQVSEQGQQIGSELELLREQLRGLSQAVSERDQLRQYQQRLEREQSQQAQLLQQFEQELAEGRAREEGRHEQFNTLQAQLMQSQEQLLPVVGQRTWQQLLQQPQQTAHFARQLSHELEQTRQAQRALETDGEKLQQLQVRLAEVTSAVEHLSASFQQQQQRVSELEQRQRTLGEQRAALLDGQPVEPFVAALEQALAHSKQQLHAARETQQAQQTKHQQLATRCEELQQRQREVDGRYRGSLLEWQGMLAEHACSESELLQRLSHNERWLQEEREAIAQIQREAAQAETLLGERRRALAHHTQEIHSLWQPLHGGADTGTDTSLDTDTGSAEPAESWPEPALLAARRQTVETTLEALDEQIFARRSQLQRDQEQGSEAKQLQAKLAEQQAQVELWGALKELIGSADGSKFRTFAQSLTLDSLLVLANHHLQDLAPRYQLARVPGADLALQVIDRDMGDEIRAVESLSGGESFLVSLALALGLASLSSSQAPIESLFIDEGFGTLDPQSLDLALACLDSLQASGRQIGVISHVQALVERIGAQVRVEPQGGGRSTLSVALGA